MDDRADAELWVTFGRFNPTAGKMRIKNVEYTIVSLTSGDMKKFIQVGILARDRNGEILALWGAFRQEPEESFKLHMDTSDGRHLVFA